MINVSEIIDAPRERIWDIITNPDHWQEIISGIIDVDVLERPERGIVGLKWMEKRVFFGKEATETMWITSAEPNRSYETRAESHGAVYISSLRLDDANGKTRLTMQFTVKPVSFAAKMMSMLGFMFNGSIRKALEQDLRDIREAAERAPEIA